MSPPDSGAVTVAKKADGAQDLYPINMVVSDYDRTRPLVEGRVKP